MVSQDKDREAKDVLFCLLVLVGRLRGSATDVLKATRHMKLDLWTRKTGVRDLRTYVYGYLVPGFDWITLEGSLWLQHLEVKHVKSVRLKQG